MGIEMESRTPTGMTREPIFLPEMTLGVRPVWIATWAAQVYGAVVLAPVLLPVYGERLPGWLWFGVPIQVIVHLGIGVYRNTLKPRGVWWFPVAATATTGTSFIFTFGLCILATYRPTLWETLALAAFGVFGLAFLVFLERFGFGMERTLPMPLGAPSNTGAGAADLPLPLFVALVALLVTVVVTILVFLLI